MTRRGRGGFGEVWEAEAAGGFRVALKIVRLPTEARSAEVSALTVVRGIRHPNLLVSFGAWQEDGVLIVGMELADRSLWDRFIEAEDQGLRGIPRSELLGYLWDVASGIDHLNEPRHTLEGRPGVGVQHRDLKPQNILLFGGGAKVADFGEAQVMDGPVAPNNGTWTLSYAAPEFFDGFTSHRSDQYALAVTYCQLRGGQLPYLGTDVTVTAGHLLGTPDLEGLPEPERPILTRALAKRPEDRWPNCTAMIEALRALRTANGLAVPETLHGPTARQDEFRLRESSGTGELSGTMSFLDSKTQWDEDEDDDEVAEGGDFELASLDHFESAPPDHINASSTQPPASSPSYGPVTGTLRSDREGLTVSATRGGASTRVMVTRAAVALVTAGLLLAATEARTLSGRLRRVSVTTRRDVPRPPTVEAESAPLPGEIAQEVLTPPSTVPATVWNVPRPPMTVISTVGGAPDTVSPPPDRPVPAPTAPALEVAIESTRTPPEKPAVPLLDDEPVPPRAEDLALAAGPMPDPLSEPSSERSLSLPGDPPVDSAPILPATRQAPPTLELPPEVQIRAGETTKLRVRVDREGGSGPAVLRFAGMTSGVSVHGPAIPAEAQETEVVVSAAADALPAVADLGVSVEVGDHRAEARVRLTVLPSAASEAYARGRELLKRGDQARASLEFSAAIKADSGHALAYCFRAVAAHIAGRPREALADYTAAIRLKSDIDIAYGARGRIYYEAGNLTKALADYTAAIRLRPDNAITRGARAQIYSDLGQYDLAMADYTEVIRLKPKSAEARYRRGMIRYTSGDNAGAVVDFSEAIKLDPAKVLAYRARGDAFAWLHNQAKADADRAMVDRLSRTSARPVDLQKADTSQSPPAVKPKAQGRIRAAAKGPGFRQPPGSRSTASNVPVGLP